MIDGTVDVAEYLGADTYLIVDAGAAGRITVRTDGDTPVREGEAVGLAAPGNRLSFFDSDGKAI